MHGDTRFDVVAFDADDTLWHNETLFEETQGRLARLLQPFCGGEDVTARLLETEKRNIEHFGYGVKGFTLSMIETALDLGGERLPGRVVREILELGRAMMAHPVELLEGAADVVRGLAEVHTLLLITKGDLFHQESKIARSGLADSFAHLEIVSEKDAATYRRIAARHGVDPARFVMVGNSLKSDILPVLEIGGTAVYVPYHVAWALEQADAPDGAGYHEIGSLAELPALLDRLAAH